MVTRAVLWILLTIATALVSESEASPRPVPSEPTKCSASAAICRAWIAFRHQQNIPFQALSVLESSDESVVIISEAPPPFTSGQLTELAGAVFGDDLLEVSTLRWSVGYDAWLEDVVLRVKHRSIDERRARVMLSSLEAGTLPGSLVERLLDLHRAVHGTSETFWIHRIELDHAMASPMKLPNLQVNPEDVRRWTDTTGMTWNRIEALSAASRLTTQSLTGIKLPAVFVSTDERLVLLVVPRRTPLSTLAVPFKRFALATDLLVAATQTPGGTTLLLGRAREIPMSELPPLRFETLADLVADPSESLAQSYERRRLFAGKIRDSAAWSGWDWAPILLSRQLEDSEFGTLLNLSDQILKSQAEAGEVTYHAFDTPRAATWPFGRYPASAYFKNALGTDALIFNWNTRGYVALTELQNQRVMTVSDTAALPALFIPLKGAGEQAEPDAVVEKRREAAQSWFVAQGSPLLTRAAQNTFLYAVAQNLLVLRNTSEWKRPRATSRSDMASQELRRIAGRWLNDLLGVPQTGPSAELRQRIEDAMESFKLTRETMIERIATPQVLVQQLVAAQAEAHRLDVNVQGFAKSAIQDEHEALEAFKQFCSAVSGEIEPDARGFRCQYDRRNRSAGAGAEVRVDALEKKSAQSAQQLDVLAASRDEAAQRFITLLDQETTLRDIGTLAAAVAVQDGQLSGALARVVQATGRVESGRTIRTASVVLSRNHRQAESIGGHNLDSAPVLMRMVPNNASAGKQVRTTIDKYGRPVLDVPQSLLGGAHQYAAAQVREALPAGAPPPIRPTDSGLKFAEPPERPGRRTLLAMMRDAKPAVEDPAVKALAESCACDILIQRDADGTIQAVRNAPPPMHVVLPGRASVIDFIAESSKRDVIHMHGFDSSTAWRIGEGVVQKSRKPLASSERAPGAVDMVAIRTVDGEPIRIQASRRGRAALSEVAPWHLAEISDANPALLAASRLGRTPSASDASAVIVRFGPATESSASPQIGIYAEGTRADASNSLLSSVIVGSRSLVATSDAALTMEKSLDVLARRIRSDLSPKELAFFIEENLADGTIVVRAWIPALAVVQ
jgi:hypothetical protein